MVLVIETDYVTVTPTPTLTIAAPTALTAFLSTTAPTLNTISPTSIPSPLPPTINTTLPFAFNPPPNPPPKPNSTVIILLLIFVIILAILVCGFVGYVIYLRCNGRCLNCKDLKAQIGKWESGELKRITKEMVKKREAVNVREKSVGGEADLESGWKGVHKETLEKLEGREKVAFWKKLFQHARGRGVAELVEDTQPTDSPSAMPDRFFLVVDSSSVRGTSTSSGAPSSKHSDFDVDDNHPPPRPASSICSQPTAIGQGPWSFKEYATADVPSIDNISRVDHSDQQERHPAPFAGGDLADPRMFEDLNENCEEREDENVSTVSSYKQPDWRLNKRFSDRGRGKYGE